jgi:hypothetical protein
MRHAARNICLVALTGIGMAFSGCATEPPKPEQAPHDMYGRQQQAMKHPLDYSPFQENPDISGGDVGEYNPKSLGKDLHDFFNP